MPRLVRRELSRVLPPHRLLRRLPPLPGTRLLDALAPEGWGSSPGRESSLRSLLAMEPEMEFRGGLDALEDALRWLAPGPDTDPLARVLIGSLSYELGRGFELPPPPSLPPETPAVCLGGYRAVYAFDPHGGRGEITGSSPSSIRALEERLRCAAESAEGERLGEGPAGPRVRARPCASDASFRKGVRAIQRWIRAGDVYQVNLSRRIDFAPVPPPLTRSVYCELALKAPAPFAAYLDAGDHAVVSNSPERLLRTVGARVETCPIKGTRPRGSTPEEDRWMEKDLIGSPKDRAEHVMIVDLERNDLGRVCEIGSVRVERLAEIRSYPTVHHLVSSIQGRLREPGDIVGLLRATLPGGSITGAPKIRAMELIDRLEPVPRGIYTGGIGVIDASGDVDLSIAIRTAVAVRDRLSLHVGGGIVADSDPQAELQETNDKGSAFSRLWSAGPGGT